jgi:2-methylisocitrate lyase-like PEP mutase family enzyme
VTRAAEAGAVGGSIEDYDPEGKIYEIGHATERIAAAAEAAGNTGFPFTLTARAENLFRHSGDLDDTVARLQAYEGAGADVLYAPWLRTDDEIRAVCEATSKPVNVLALPGMTVKDIAESGAQRISVGSQLALVALAAFGRAAEEIRDAGTFDALKVRAPINEWLSA